MTENLWTEDWWADDEKLASALREAVRYADDVPRDFVEAGKAVYTWHNIDAELAALMYDSAIDSDQALAHLRSESAVLRQLTFASESVTIELEITEEAVLGQVVPPQHGDVEVCDAVTTLATAVADEAGCFVIRPQPSTPFRLLLQLDGKISVLTGWITL